MALAVYPVQIRLYSQCHLLCTSKFFTLCTNILDINIKIVNAFEKIVVENSSGVRRGKGENFSPPPHSPKGKKGKRDKRKRKERKEEEKKRIK